jgi:acyl-CoA thioester hydrolase
MTARTEPTAGGNQETARRSDYSLVVRIATRWNDYDMLGHVNNVEYYRYFEIIVLTSLARAGLNWRQDSIIPFTVENHCCFRRPLMPVDTMDGCFRIARISRSSATYELGLFMPNDETPSAYGYFIHVFVDRHTERPAKIPDGIRTSFDTRQTRRDKRDPESIGASALFPAAVHAP